MTDAGAITTIGFDADDTLWHNERLFKAAEARFAELMADFTPADAVFDRLLAVERRNVSVYGFGIKGFMLSMIETALEVTGGRVPQATIGEILALGRDMLNHPIETLPYVAETLERLAGRFRLLLITKGDLLDQERKLAKSGLADFFDAVEIVSDKTADTYARVFGRHADGAERAAMVGNSLRSDILPALAAGAFAVHVPHELTWAYEAHVDDAPAEHPRLYVISDFKDLMYIFDNIK